jgi:predicted AlkP superfamily pyrophosphatase or phosphodiesterase
MKKIFLQTAVFAILTISVFTQIKPIKDLKPTVILISLDGFRYDYLEKFQPKTLNELAKKGIRAKWMIPSFPTKTYPNHYAIATGLYPSHNGIVENNIYDFGSVFTLSDRKEVENGRWWLGEPIWVTAEKQGQISASLFYVGTEAPINGIQPRFWERFDGKMPYQERIDKALGWFDLPSDKRPTMMSLYFEEVDGAGHDFSPDSEETKQAVLKIDGIIELLVEGLKQRKIFDKVNLIIVSDHGMAVVDVNNTVFLDDYFNLETAERILYTNEIVQIFPKQQKADEIISKLRNIQHATCWKKDEIPARFHYTDSTRIAPIVCSTEESWMLTTHSRYEDLKKRFTKHNPRGGHGYDNQLASMRAIFIAHGKAFKKSKVVEPFENVDVYNMMCKILGLTPAKNDGNFVTINKILR